jgi:hypothetical protein
MRVSWSHQGLFRDLPAGTTLKPEINFPTVSFGTAGNVPQGRTQDNRIFSDALSHHFVAGGAHDLKVGFEANIVPVTDVFNQTMNGEFEFLNDAPVVPGDPSTLPFRFEQGIVLDPASAVDGILAMKAGLNIYSTFINDEWRPTSNVTLNLGLRYDWQSWRAEMNGQDIPDDMTPQAFWVSQVTGPLFGQRFKPAPNKRNEFGPRFGTTWDPRGDGRTVVRGGYGIYYDQIAITTLEDVIYGTPGLKKKIIGNDARTSGIPNDFFPNLPGSSVSLPESVASSVEVASPTAGAPYTHQITGGMTRQIGSDYAVSFDYVYMRGEHFPLTTNVNARQADGTFPLLDSGVQMLLYSDIAPMRIHQAQFRLTRRFSGRLGFLFGYTLGSAKTIANNGTPSDNYNPMLDWGPTSNDVRHRFVGNVMYQLPLGVQLGGIVTATSAAPYNVTAGRDLNGDGSNNDRPAGVAYNSGRGDAFFDTDLRISKQFAVGQGHIDVLWEMYNLFNTVNFNNYQGNMRSAAGFTSTGIPTGFGQPRSAFDAFQGQLGLKITF